MKRILLPALVFLLSTNIVFSQNSENEPKSLSCSKNGTYIFFINGMNYKEEKQQEVLRSMTEMLTSTEVRKRLDVTQISVDGKYNTSEDFWRDL